MNGTEIITAINARIDRLDADRKAADLEQWNKINGIDKILRGNAGQPGLAEQVRLNTSFREMLVRGRRASIARYWALLVVTFAAILSAVGTWIVFGASRGIQ